MTRKTKETAVRRYNDIMECICHEHLTIGTSLSGGTENWNLRDMLSEMQYTLDLWNDPDSIAWQDAHDESQPSDKSWYRQWRNEIKRMERWISHYKDEALQLECTVCHSSKYD